MTKFSRLMLAVVATLFAVAANVGCKSAREVDTQQAAADSIANVVSRQLFEKQGFMLSGDRIALWGGRMLNVIPNTNFILVEGNSATIQLSPGIGAGPNGVGGFTFKGLVSNYQVKVKKSETVVTFLFSSNGRSGDVRIVLYKNGNKATAYINSTFYSGKTQLWGEILPLGGTPIMEGRSR